MDIIIVHAIHSLNGQSCVHCMHDVLRAADWKLGFIDLSFTMVTGKHESYRQSLEWGKEEADTRVIGPGLWECAVKAVKLTVESHGCMQPRLYNLLGCSWQECTLETAGEEIGVGCCLNLSSYSPLVLTSDAVPESCGYHDGRDGWLPLSSPSWYFAVGGSSSFLMSVSNSCYEADVSCLCTFQSDSNTVWI